MGGVDAFPDGRTGGEATVPPLDVSDSGSPDVTPGISQPDQGGDADEDVSWESPFAPAVCGAPPYEWLSPEEMGAVVMSEETTLSNLTPAMVDDILKETGYESFGKASYGARNFKIRYVTQDRGKKIEATAVVGVPTGATVQWPAPMMLWLHGTTGFMDDCSPSRNLLTAPLSTALWASQGYVTVAPDFIGLVGMGEKSPPGSIHPYLVGEATAIASIDALRATVSFLEQEPELGLPDPKRVAALGGSQGGHAAMFVEHYWPYYARGFELRGVVAAIPPISVSGEAQVAFSAPIPGSANLLTALVAMKNWYQTPGDLKGLLTNQEPYFAADNIEGWLSGSCHPDVDPTDVNEITDVFLPEIANKASQGLWDEIPPWGCFVQENSLPGSSVKRAGDVPILTTFSELDELVNMPIERENWLKLCEAGWKLEYLECAGLKHTQGGLAALPYSRKWLADRIYGVQWNLSEICVLHDPVDCAKLVQ